MRDRGGASEVKGGESSSGGRERGMGGGSATEEVELSPSLSQSEIQETLEVALPANGPENIKYHNEYVKYYTVSYDQIPIFWLTSIYLPPFPTRLS